MPTQLQNEDGLMLITLYTSDKATLSLMPKDAFLHPNGHVPPERYTEITEGLDKPTVYRYQNPSTGFVADAQFLSLKSPEQACASLAAFLTGHWLDQEQGVKETAIAPVSPEVQVYMGKLLGPILTECPPSKAWNRPLLAAAWRDAHPSFMKNLDTIFSSLDLMSVVRHRQSVTQGEASVLCCGEKVVRYGDDQWYQSRDGYICNGFREKEGTLHGEIISGWGSAIPDEQFRRAALVQFADRISRFLEPSKTLSKMIDQAKNQASDKTVTPAKTDRSQER